MPHAPTHPPFLFSLTKLHGETMRAEGVSSASCSLALSGHTGTHMDALCHFSQHGLLHGGAPAAHAQTYPGGITQHSIADAPPLIRRGVLLDLARLFGAPLPVDFEVLPEHLEAAQKAAGATLGAGDVALLRTGWGAWWNDAPRYVRDMRGPGPSLAGARWLSERGLIAAGSDTIAFEKAPAPAMPVHAHLLVERGIHIIECLNLEELSATGAGEFLFLAAPLKIHGGTASPVRALALLS